MKKFEFDLLNILNIFYENNYHNKKDLLIISYLNTRNIELKENQEYINLINEFKSYIGNGTPINKFILDKFFGDKNLILNEQEFKDLIKNRFEELNKFNKLKKKIFKFVLKNNIYDDYYYFLKPLSKGINLKTFLEENIRDNNNKYKNFNLKKSYETLMSGGNYIDIFVSSEYYNDFILTLIKNDNNFNNVVKILKSLR